MKKIMKYVLVAVLVLAAAAASAQQNTFAASDATLGGEDKAVTIQTEFFGCTLGVSTLDASKQALAVRKLAATDFDGALVVEDASLNGFNFSAALIGFDENSVMESITFLNSGLERDDAKRFAQNLLGELQKKYILVKRTISGLDSYFTSVAGVTCQLATVDMDDSYFVSLKYELGTPDLGASD